ncbi:MAG: Ig-like domain-containing protein, partial [Clostridiales bacterium]|nr:Ig-like domain-containing protein [Clostridiales bacterium]
MKKRNVLFVFVALLCALAFTVTACSHVSKPTQPEQPAPEAKIALDVTDARLDVYETLRVTATTENTDAAVVWRSSDSAVVTVENGLIKAVGVGDATVTATAGDVSATCSITVYNSFVAPVLTVDHAKISIAKGDSFSVTLKTMWKGNEISEGVEYAWKLGEGKDDTVADISASGKTATFTGKEYGDTEFVVSATVLDTPLVQKVAVKVCNPDISFAVSDLEQGIGGYTARLALLKLSDTVTEITPTVTVYDQNKVVQDANLTWRIEGEAGIIERDETTGKISAVSEGVVNVIGTYNNVDLIIRAEVYRPQIEIENTVYFETNKLTPKQNGVATGGGESGIALPNIQGTVTGAKLGNANIFSSYSNDTLVIDKANLRTDKNVLGVTQILRVDTDKAIYTAAAKVVTMAISTPQELQGFGSVAANETVGDSFWDGYFVLANDIRMTSAYTTFGKASVEWDNPDKSGFRGTFDGQSHNIDNFYQEPCDAGGFVTAMAKGGVIKNVSFTNASPIRSDEARGGSGLLCSVGAGTIENVYIQYTSDRAGWAQGQLGAFYTQGCNNTTAIKNVFVDARILAGDYNTALGAAYPASENYRGVYCVGVMPEHGYRKQEQAVMGVANVCGFYPTYTDLRAAAVDFTEWEGDFWQIVNGLPYPKNLALPNVDTTANKTKIETSGSTTTVTVDKYATVTLDSRSVLDGVKLSGIEQSDQSVQKLVFEPVNEDKTVTVTVKSAYDAAGAGTQYTVNLKANTPLSDPDFDGFEGGGMTRVDKNNTNAVVSVVDGAGVDNSKALRLQIGGSDEAPRPLLILDDAMKARLNESTANKFSVKVRVERGGLPAEATFNLRFGNFKAGAGDHQHDGYASGGREDNITLGTWYEVTYEGESLAKLKETGVLWMWIETSNDGGRYDFAFYLDNLTVHHTTVKATLDFENAADADMLTVRSYASSRISTCELSDEKAKSGSSSIKVSQNQSGALIVKLPDAMKDAITDGSVLTVHYMITEAKKNDGTQLSNATMNFFSCTTPDPNTDKAEETWQDCLVRDNGVD